MRDSDVIRMLRDDNDVGVHSAHAGSQKSPTVAPSEKIGSDVSPLDAVHALKAKADAHAKVRRFVRVSRIVYHLTKHFLSHHHPPSSHRSERPRTTRSSFPATVRLPLFFCMQ